MRGLNLNISNPSSLELWKKFGTKQQRDDGIEMLVMMIDLWQIDEVNNLFYWMWKIEHEWAVDIMHILNEQDDNAWS